MLASHDRLRVCVDIPESEAAFVDANNANADSGDPVTIRRPRCEIKLFKRG